MRILYVAPDQPIPGTQGGSVHVASVADGLAARGHDVHVLAAPGEGGFPSGSVHWYDARPPMGMQKLRLLRSARVLTSSGREMSTLLSLPQRSHITIFQKFISKWVVA